jgi:hypothetical protein
VALMCPEESGLNGAVLSRSGSWKGGSFRNCSETEGSERN